MDFSVLILITSNLTVKYYWSWLMSFWHRLRFLTLILALNKTYLIVGWNLKFHSRQWGESRDVKDILQISRLRKSKGQMTEGWSAAIPKTSPSVGSSYATSYNLHTPFTSEETAFGTKAVWGGSVCLSQSVYTRSSIGQLYFHRQGFHPTGHFSRLAWLALG